MSMARMIAAMCLCCLLVTPVAFGKTANTSTAYEGAITTTRTEIWRGITNGKIGSATAAITVGSRVVYAEGFGMANREQSLPVTPKTLFNIGSISKVYVAAAIMLLVDDGRVSLDKPVTDYLSEFKMADDRYKKITVRMLLNHQSGLPGTASVNPAGYEYNDNLKKGTVDMLARAHLKHDPGAMAVYCNDGFTLAEIIVERVSGVKYIDFLDKRIFKRLGLKNTGKSLGDIKGKPFARYYDAHTGKMHPPESLSVLGAGGLSATATEVALFADSFAADNALLKKASLAEMKKAQQPAFSGKLRNGTFTFGLGWDLTSFPRYEAAGIQVLGKSGGTGNYSSMVFTVPEKRISVAVIASGPQSGAMKIALDILDAVLVEKKLVSKEAKPLLIQPEAQTPPQEEASFSGFYANEHRLTQVVIDGDKKSAALYSFKGHEKSPAMTLIYNNGYYYDPAGNRSYFISTDGEGFWVSNPLPMLDAITLQKVKPVEAPKSLKINMDEKVWLRRNVPPSESTVIAEQTHLARSFLHTDLPGYVDFLGIKRIESPEFAGMPLDAIRDQTELTLVEKSGTTWAWISDLLYSPAETAAALKAGENTVTIGRDGHSEWLVADEGMILSFTTPKRGRMIVFSSGNAIYDSVIDTGDVYAAKGSFIELGGLANDLLTVTARPVGR